MENKVKTTKNFGNTDKITAIIISFNRPKYTIDCLITLRRTYPDINIIVGDNGYPFNEVKKVCQRVGAEYILFPFDCGVPYLRNEIFKMVKTPYILIGDDDFYYTKDANLDKAQKFLDTHKKISIIGGRVYNKNKIQDWQGYIHSKKGYFFEKMTADELRYKEDDDGLRYCIVDMMTNFWVGKLKNLPQYDEDQKISHEHFAYMIKLLNKVDMAFTPDMAVHHKKRYYYYKEYKEYRYRQEDMDYLERKFGGIRKNY